MIVKGCYSFFSLCVVCLLSGKNETSTTCSGEKDEGGNPYLEWMCGKSMQATVKCSGVHALKRVTRLNKSPRSVCVCVSDCVTVCVCVRMLLAHRTLTLHSFKLISNWMLAQVFASFRSSSPQLGCFSYFIHQPSFFFPQFLSSKLMAVNTSGKKNLSISEP